MKRLIWGAVGINGTILIVPLIEYVHDRIIARSQGQDSEEDHLCCATCGEPLERRYGGMVCPTCHHRSENRP